MITLITGSPGGGKSLYVVSKLIPEYLADGRSVYTNIKDLDYTKTLRDGSVVNAVPTLNDIPVGDLIFPLPDDYDWRELPHGSVVIYDEAQQYFPATGRAGLSSDGRIADLDTHRHGGYDIVYLTQHPTLISSHIRKFVGLHIHLYRKWGGTYSSLYLWNHCNSSPELEIGEEQKADKRLFRFPRKAFSFYKSSELHTVKFKLPKKFIYILLGLVFLLSGVLFLGYHGFNNIVSVYKGDNLISFESSSSNSPDYFKLFERDGGD